MKNKVFLCERCATRLILFFKEGRFLVHNTNNYPGVEQPIAGRGLHHVTGEVTRFTSL